MSWKAHEILWQHRRSVRLKGYDCSQAGAYFVTICAHERQCLFGEVVDGAVPCNEYGATAGYSTPLASFGIGRVCGYAEHVHGIGVIMPTNVGAPPVG